MTILIAETMSHGKLQVTEDTNITGESLGSGSYKWGGAYAMLLGGNPSYWLYGITAVTEVYLGVWLRGTSGLPVGGLWIEFDNATTGSMYVNSSGQIEGRVNGSVVETGITIGVQDEPHNFQMWYKAADTGGRLVIKYDGQTVIDYTGDTLPAGATNIVKVGVHGQATNKNLECGLFTYGSTWPGVLKMHTMAVNSDVSVQWDPSTGTTNYAVVDEIPAVDTDYVSTTVTAEDDEYGTVGDFDDTNKTIKALVVNVRAKVDTSGSLVVGCDSGASQSFGSAKALTTEFMQEHEIFEVDPATSSAWASDTAINGANAIIRSSL